MQQRHDGQEARAAIFQGPDESFLAFGLDRQHDAFCMSIEIGRGGADFHGFNTFRFEDCVEFLNSVNKPIVLPPPP